LSQIGGDVAHSSGGDHDEKEIDVFGGIELCGGRHVFWQREAGKVEGVGVMGVDIGSDILFAPYHYDLLELEGE
jgi:hypothetical protein